MNTPKGYVALRNSYDGKTILVDARGLYVAPRPSEGGSKETCCVASVYYDDTGWTIAESFDEVCAKLAAALGEQTPAAPDLSAEDRIQSFATAIGVPFGHDALVWAQREIGILRMGAIRSEQERAVVEAAMVWDVDTDYTKSPDPVEKLESALRALRAARGGA